MPAAKMSVSMPEPVAAALVARGDTPSSAITRVVLRYIGLLSAARRELRNQFSDAECALVLDACNGTAYMDMVSVRLLPEGVADAIEIDNLDGKWQLDGGALVVKLRATTLTQRMALVDGLQRWWDNPERGGYSELLADPEADQALAVIF